MITHLETINISKTLLSQWKSNIKLTNYEREIYASSIKDLNNQIKKIDNREIEICIFGKVGVGKSSLLNALINKKIFKTDVVHGSTTENTIFYWKRSFCNINKIKLIDTPGIDDVNSKLSKDSSYAVALKSDLILFIIDSDLSQVERNAIKILIENNKPILLILNRCDQWKKNEINILLNSIKNKLPINKQSAKIVLVASAPRQPQIIKGGKVRSTIDQPKIKSLLTALTVIIDKKAEFLLTINSLTQADRLYNCLKAKRLERNKVAAQSLIGKFATLKASGVAINPILMIDVATGLALDTALIVQLSKIYGLEICGKSARKLAKKISLQNSFLGGTQIGIQMTLSLIQKILFTMSPLTGGLSLAPAAPVAIAQAALAVYSTRLTGQLAAKNFLKGSNKKNDQPKLMLKYLLKKNKDFAILINEWKSNSSYINKDIQILLP